MFNSFFRYSVRFLPSSLFPASIRILFSFSFISIESACPTSKKYISSKSFLFSCSSDLLFSLPFSTTLLVVSVLSITSFFVYANTIRSDKIKIIMFNILFNLFFLIKIYPYKSITYFSLKKTLF